MVHPELTNKHGWSMRLDLGDCLLPASWEYWLSSCEPGLADRLPGFSYPPTALSPPGQSRSLPEPAMRALRAVRDRHCRCPWGTSAAVCTPSRFRSEGVQRRSFGTAEVSEGQGTPRQLRWTFRLDFQAEALSDGAVPMQRFQPAASVPAMRLGGAEIPISGIANLIHEAEGCRLWMP
jgi:hypothetical protein